MFALMHRASFPILLLMPYSEAVIFRSVYLGRYFTFALMHRALFPILLLMPYSEAVIFCSVYLGRYFTFALMHRALFPILYVMPFSEAVSSAPFSFGCYFMIVLMPGAIPPPSFLVPYYDFCSYCLSNQSICTLHHEGLTSINSSCIICHRQSIERQLNNHDLLCLSFIYACLSRRLLILLHRSQF